MWLVWLVRQNAEIEQCGRLTTEFFTLCHCFLQPWEYSAFYWGIPTDLHFSASGKEVSLAEKRPKGEGQLAVFFHSSQQNCPRHYNGALRCIWELEITLTSWENCSERISDCSTDFIVKARRMLHDAGECYSLLSLIEALKVEDSNLAIS